MSRLAFLPLLVLIFLTTSADVTKGDFGARKDPASPTDRPNKPSTDKNRASYPFRGTIASVDSSGKTLILVGKKKNRIILISAETRFFKDGGKTTMAETVAGARVTGTVRKNSSGQEEALTVRLAGKASE
jgi:hypothetical protein